MQKTTIQKISHIEEDKFNLALKYYKILFAINDISLGEKQLKLVAFTAIKGNLQTGGTKELFCKMTNTSAYTTYNLISKLVKKNILIRHSRNKITITPALSLSFDNPLILVISLNEKQKDG